MDKKHTIYILLTHSGSMFSKAINAYTKDPYTHVSLAFDHQLKDIYSFGRLKPNNPVIGGFVKEDIEFGTCKKFPKTKCALYSLKITEEQYWSIVNELERFKSQSKKYNYNLLGVITAMFHYPMSREYSYFCSQFVSELLLKSGVAITKKHPGLTSPMDIMGNKNLEFVYSGYLKDYILNNYNPIVEVETVQSRNIIFDIIPWNKLVRR